MMNKETSLFHKYGEFVEVPLSIKDNIAGWDDKAKDGTAEYGKKILYIIKKYKILNKQSLLKCLQIENRNSWKRDMLSKTLKSMRKVGYLSMYEMRGRPQEEQSLMIYMLTDTGVAYISNQEEEPIEGIDIKDTQSCLSLLSLNQWHINLQYVLEKNLVHAYYQTFVIKKNLKVPSLVQYQRQNNAENSKRHKTSISLFTFPAPHAEEQLEQFMLKIIANYEFLIENQSYRPAIIVVLCENMNHAAWISWKLNKVKEMRPLNAFVYALDIMTNKEQMLSLLYSCDADEEGMIRSNVSLK